MSRKQKRKSDVDHVRIDAFQQHRRLDNFLASQLREVPKSRIYQMIRRGEVRVNGSRAKPEYRLEEGDDIRLPPVIDDTREGRDRPVPDSVARQVMDAILFENARMLVIDKPAGLAVHGGTGQAYGLIDVLRRSHAGGAALQLVHRLDRDTSGCLLIAKDVACLRQLHVLLRDRGMEKHYLALLEGRLERRRLLVDTPLDRDAREHGQRTVKTSAEGRESRSSFSVAERFPAATLVSVSIATGRTHQIRVHAQSIGHPVAGDDRYGNRPFNRSMRRLGLRRIFLHAWKLKLPGLEDVPEWFEAPLPADLVRVLETLRKEQRGAAL